MKTDNLNQLDSEQLKQIGVWMAWAERHALREADRVDGDWSFHYKGESTVAISTRIRWKAEIADLSSTQDAIRLLVEDMARKKAQERNP